MLIEGTLIALAIAAWRKSGKKEMTQEQEEIYIGAMENLAVPEKLRKLADVFEKQGFRIHAKMLRGRATLRETAKTSKGQERREAYEKGMKSTNPEAIERLAIAFESVTATGAALALRKRAAELREKAKKEQFSELNGTHKAEEKNSHELEKTI